MTYIQNIKFRLLKIPLFDSRLNQIQGVHLKFIEENLYFMRKSDKIHVLKVLFSPFAFVQEISLPSGKQWLFNIIGKRRHFNWIISSRCSRVRRCQLNTISRYLILFKGKGPTLNWLTLIAVKSYRRFRRLPNFNFKRRAENQTEMLQKGPQANTSRE